MQILVILPNNLGDIIMTLPTLQGLRLKYPDSRIIFLAEKGFEAGLKYCSYIDKLFIFDRNELKKKILTGNWKLIKESFSSQFSLLTSENIDTVINFSQHDYTPYIVTWLKGGSLLGRYFNRGGNQSIDDLWSIYLYSIPFSRRSNSLHASDVYRRISGVCDIKTDCNIDIKAKELEKSSSYLESLGLDLDNKKIVIFQPGAAFPSKRWLREYYVELGKMLLSKGYQIIISGAPAESVLAQSIADEIGDGVVSSAGKTGFREAIVNLNFADALVTGDTALMHAAAGLNVKTYSIFGSTNPVETGPYGESHFVFTSSRCSEFPCFKRECDHHTCMKSITPEALYKVITGEEEEVEGCCVYETSIAENGDVKLEKVNRKATDLFNKEEAHLIQSILNENVNSSLYNESLLVDNRLCADIFENMSENLENYLQTGNSELLKEFELDKSNLEKIDGISDFWGAFINIRLNSIPIIDSIAAVKQSISVCREMAVLLRIE